MYPAEQEILVIDGDETARALIGQTLLDEGFAVTTVADGQAALSEIEARPFALIVAEIRLPGTLDGFTMLHQARALQPSIKCLFTSRFAPAPLWSNAAQDEFIAKPFHRRELLGCVFELIERDRILLRLSPAELPPRRGCTRSPKRLEPAPSAGTGRGAVR
jgi:DNA-binding response OmpR family regulator